MLRCTVSRTHWLCAVSPRGLISNTLTPRSRRDCGAAAGSRQPGVQSATAAADGPAPVDWRAMGNHGACAPPTRDSYAVKETDSQGGAERGELARYNSCCGVIRPTARLRYLPLLPFARKVSKSSRQNKSGGIIDGQVLTGVGLSAFSCVSRQVGRRIRPPNGVMVENRTEPSDSGATPRSRSRSHVSGRNSFREQKKARREDLLGTT